MLRSFAKIAAVVALLTGVASTSMAQDADIIRPITREGSAAMIFTINGLGSFGLAGPSAGAVPGAGFKYFIADELALRVLVGLNTSSSGDKDSAGGASSSTNFGIGAGVEHHFRPLYSTSPYVGGMITFSSMGTTTTVGSNESKSSGTAIGVLAFLGFDWFFTRGIAVGGEYQLGFSTASHSTTSGGTTINTPSTSGIMLAGTGNVHVDVYF